MNLFNGAVGGMEEMALWHASDGKTAARERPVVRREQRCKFIPCTKTSRPEFLI
jgi:hypothetical protein